MIRHVPRERDDVVLAGLAARSSGDSWPRVAEVMKTSPGAARIALMNVLKADLADSGEPPAFVQAKYW